MTTSLPRTMGSPRSAPSPTTIVFGPAGRMSKVMTSASAEEFAAAIAALKVHWLGLQTPPVSSVEVTTQDEAEY